MKMPETTIFLRVGSCNFDTMWIGKHRITTSIKTFNDVIAIQKAWTSLHLSVNSKSGCQEAEIGRQRKIWPRIVAMHQATDTAPMMRLFRLKLVMENIRRYKSNMDTFTSVIERA